VPNPLVVTDRRSAVRCIWTSLR